MSNDGIIYYRPRLRDYAQGRIKGKEDSSMNNPTQKPSLGTTPFSTRVPQLLQSHLGHLSSSAISLEVITGRGYESVLSHKRLADLGFSRAQCRIPGVLMPIWGVDGSIVSYQYRPDSPRLNSRGKPRLAMTNRLT